MTAHAPKVAAKSPPHSPQCAHWGTFPPRGKAGRFLFPFAIHPPLAVGGAWVGAAGAAAPTVVVDAVYHSPALGGNHHLAAGDS